MELSPIAPYPLSYPNFACQKYCFCSPLKNLSLSLDNAYPVHSEVPQIFHNNSLVGCL